MKAKILIISVLGLLIFGGSFFAQTESKKTQYVAVKVDINAPAELVWQAMVLDYGAISNFSPYIYSSNYENGSLKGVVGAERKCNFDEKGKQWVHEKIFDIDPEERVMKNVPIDGEKLPLDFENSYALYKVKDNGDGTSTASYEFFFRTKPAFMGGIAKGGFKKQLGGTLIGLKHYIETGERVTPMNKKYNEIKGQYEKPVLMK
ncbi:MAG: SRPBCC family protein [Bacteroidia bacterium]|nr:SRPBCC family protein [Bacteroidia bacterium]